MRILFLAHRVPFPPDRGDKIRSFHVLKHLATRARVHLVAFADDPRDVAPAAALRAIVESCTIVPRRKSTLRAAAEALAGGRALSMAAFDDPRLRAAADGVLAREPIDLIYAFSGQMGQYVPARGHRLAMDLVDADSAKFAAYAQAARGPKAWMLRREARLLAADERALAARADACFLVSAAEAALVPGARALENGIDTGMFDPAAGFAPVAKEGRLIVFTGQMDYRPNVEAVVGFVRNVLPAVRRAHPDARFAIVGRAPVREVRDLAGDAVIVTGEVADVRGWLAAADVVVAPLLLARGVQNKVLEAMAMARPVVASPAASEGIDHGGTIRVGDGAPPVAGLLGDPGAADALGLAAREQVRRRYSWEAAMAPLDAFLAGLNGGAAA